MLQEVVVTYFKLYIELGEVRGNPPVRIAGLRAGI
jgi:hypothetical protein